MTEWTIMTTDQESDEIYEKKRRCIFRDERIAMKEGDIIHFQNMRNGKRVYHKNNRIPYQITIIDDYRTVPITGKIKMINFKEYRR